MPIISGVTVDFKSSPRIITIPIPIVQISIQDLHDTLIDIEDNINNLIFPKLIDSSGKENLGGGVFVGVSSTLQNARLAFAARDIPATSGSTPQADITGQTLVDSNANFINDQILPGALIFNFTDRSVAEVLSINSATSITHTKLSNGINNDWSLNDNYNIYNIIQCNVTGGNLVAVDVNGVDLDPIFPTAFTQVVKTSSSSATIAALEIEQLKFLIESRRPHHSGFGKMLFVDPVNGDNNNEGNSAARAFKTLTQALSVVKDFNNDVISLIAGNPLGDTILDENIIINKNNVYIRGPGRGFKIKPSTAGNPTIIINGEGVELSSFVLETSSNGTDNSLEINSNFSEIRNIWIENVTGNGVIVSNSSNTRIVKTTIKNCVQNGILISNNTTDIDIVNTTISNNSIDGIQINATGIQNVKFGIGVKIFKNAGYGINIGTGVINTVLTTDLTIFDNILGEINDQSNTTGFGGRVTSQDYGESIHIDFINGVSGTIFPRGTAALRSNNLTDAKTIAERVGIITYKFHDDLLLNASHIDWNFIGASKFPQIDVNSQNVDGSKFKFVTLTGTCNGMISVNSSNILNTVNLDGNLRNCVLVGNNKIADNALLLLHNCTSKQTTPILDFINVTTTATVDIRSYSGELQIQNFIRSTDTLIIQMIGTLIIDSTVTAGNIIVSGIGEIINNSLLNINTSGFINKSDISQSIWEELQSSHITSGTMGEQIDRIKKLTSIIPGLV